MQPRSSGEDHHTTYSDDADFDVEQDQDLNSHGLPGAKVVYEKRKPVTLHISDYANTYPLATTSFLHKLLSLSVLPVPTGGKDGAAVFIDCVGSFQPELLYESLVEHLKQHEKQNTDEITGDSEPENVQKDESVVQNPSHHELAAQKMMDHIHVVECDSSASLLETLTVLPEHLLRIDTHNSGDRVLSLVCVSGIDSFYWIERDVAEAARLEGAQPHANTSRSEPVSSQILKELKALQARFQCPLVAYSTSQIPFPVGDDNPHSDVPYEGSSLQQTYDASELFNNYVYSSLLTLQPFHTLGPGTLSYNNDKLARKKAQEAGVLATRNYGFKLHRGGALPPQLRGSTVQRLLDAAYLGLLLEKDSSIVFNM